MSENDAAQRITPSIQIRLHSRLVVLPFPSQLDGGGQPSDGLPYGGADSILQKVTEALLLRDSVQRQTIVYFSDI